MNRRHAPHPFRRVRRTVGALFVIALLSLLPDIAAAHWMRPEEIVAGLAHDARLRDQVGVVDVHRDARLPRLLIIKVRRGPWNAVPTAARLKLAGEWQETWRHNVPQGIVAVLDAATDQSLVNYHRDKQIDLEDPPAPTTRP